MSSLMAAAEAVRGLGTFPHLVLGLASDDGKLSNGLSFRRLFAGRRFAIEREANRDARSLAEAALDIDAAAVQGNQAFDDRQAEPGAVIRPCVGAARLKER